MIGVNGWCSANQASGPGRDSVGTNPLLRKTKSSRIIGRLLAVSTLFVTMPRATASHVMARAASPSIPAAAAQASGPVVGRNPMSTAAIMTIPRAIAIWTRLPPTCPVRTAARAIDIVRKRATIPSVMSIATEIDVPVAAPAIVTSRMPGTT